MVVFYTLRSARRFHHDDWQYYSVSSEIVASVSMPPCAQEGEDGTENDVDNDDVNKFIYKLDI